MTIRASLVAAFPEARRISDFLDRDWAGEGVVVSLDERPDGQWSVDAYFDAGDPDAVAASLRDRLGADAFGAELVVNALPDTDWVAAGLRSLHPVRAGRFVVHGSHDRDHGYVGRIAVEIDAGQAFGTGHHETTAGCLMVLDSLARRRRHCHALDLGCGSGVLAIALAKVLRRPVTAGDIDPIAVRVARRNAVLNGVAHRVRFVVAPGLAHRLLQDGDRYDLIVANILAKPLMSLAPALDIRLAPGGDLVLSGLLRHQRERVVAAYAAQGIYLRRAYGFGDWAVLHLGKADRARQARRR